MKKLLYFLAVIFCVLCSTTITAQVKIANRSSFQFIKNNKLQFSTESYSNYLALHQFIPPKIVDYTAVYTFSLKNETPKGAIFCRMENTCREKFNIWIKIHAGDGEASKVILKE